MAYGKMKPAKKAAKKKPTYSSLSGKSKSNGSGKSKY